MSERTIHTSPMPDVEIPDVSLSDVLLRARRRACRPGRDGRGPERPHPDLPAAVGPGPRVRRRACARAGSPRATCWPCSRRTCPSTRWSSTASRMAGGTITTINPTYTAREVRHQLDRRRAAAAGHRRRRSSRPPGRPSSRHRRRARSSCSAGPRSTGVHDARCCSAHRWPSRSPSTPDDVVVLPYSSGTTGPVQGRDAHPPQPRGQHRPERRRGGARPTTSRSSPSCRSSTSTACRC